LGLYPNPLQGSGNPTLQIYFSQPHDYVSVKVFTTAFRKVYDDRVDYVPAGTFTYSIASARFKGGESIANGLYYVLVTTPSDRWLKKLLILR